MMSSAMPRSGWLVAKKTIPITTAISVTSPLSMASWRDERVGVGDTVRAGGRKHDATTCPRGEAHPDVDRRKAVCRLLRRRGQSWFAVLTASRLPPDSIAIGARCHPAPGYSCPPSVMAFRSDDSLVRAPAS